MQKKKRVQQRLRDVFVHTLVQGGLLAKQTIYRLSLGTIFQSMRINSSPDVKCFLTIEMCYMYNQWYDISCATLYIIIYILTPCSRVLIEKLTGSQLLKKLPTFYRNRRFFTAITNASHLSLSQARSIQSLPPIPLLKDPS